MPTKQQNYENKARKTGAQLRQVIDSATGEVSHVADEVQARIKGEPVKSTLIALAAGVVLGLLFRRR